MVGCAPHLHPANLASILLFTPRCIFLVQTIYHKDQHDGSYHGKAQKKGANAGRDRCIVPGALKAHLVHAFDKPILIFFTQIIVSNQADLDHIAGTRQMVPHQAHVAQWRHGVVASAALDSKKRQDLLHRDGHQQNDVGQADVSANKWCRGRLFYDYKTLLSI